MLVTEITILRDQVHLREHVNVWKFEVQHHPERSHEYRDVLGGIGDVVCVTKVHGGQLCETCVSSSEQNRHVYYPKAAFRELPDDLLQAFVVRAELYLAREIKDNISILSQRFQLLVEPVKVFVEILYTVQHPPIRTETVRVHDISEGDQGRNVDRARVWDVVVRWVKVYDGYRSIERSEELVLSVAVG